VNKKIINLKRCCNKYGKKPIIFPALLLIVIILISIFGISGSSVGTYDFNTFPNDNAKKDTILNSPQPIRSDEWLVNTQFVISQYNTGFPRINKSIGEGQDMSVVLDVPYKDWSIFFKPLNLLFFFLPLNIAFALKWWLMGYLLVVSSYLLFLRIMPNRIMLSILLSLSLFFTPMIQWWYQYITLAPIYMGLFILLVLFKLYEAKNIKLVSILTILLTYLMTVFALIMYPPFQIPIVLIVLFLYVGFLISKTDNNYLHTLKKQLPAALAIITSLILITVFYLTRSNTIQSILSTSYPGERSIISGGFPIQHLIISYLQPIIQSSGNIGNYAILANTNQSEASFFVLPIFTSIFIATLLLYILKNLKKIKDNFILVAGILIIGLFISRISVPMFNELYKFTGLNIVPHNRLLLGLGLISVLLIAVSIGIAIKERISFTRNQIWLTVLVTAILSTIGLAYAYYVMPTFMPHYVISALLSMFPPIFIYLILDKKYTLALTALLVLSIISTMFINPLEISIDEVNNKQLSNTIKKMHQDDPGYRWVTNGQGELTNYVQANGGSSISGVYSYPQLKIWESFPNQDKDIYNRYAHVIFNISDDFLTPQLKLKQADVFIVNISSCDPFLKKYNVKYILTKDKMRGKCISNNYISTSYNENILYIYEVL
jgi:hypothetical protein